jgi:hypothetical protein
LPYVVNPGGNDQTNPATRQDRKKGKILGQNPAGHAGQYSEPKRECPDPRRFRESRLVNEHSHCNTPSGQLAFVT